MNLTTWLTESNNQTKEAEAVITTLMKTNKYCNRDIRLELRVSQEFYRRYTAFNDADV